MERYSRDIKGEINNLFCILNVAGSEAWSVKENTLMLLKKMAYSYDKVSVWSICNG